MGWDSRVRWTLRRAGRAAERERTIGMGMGWVRWAVTPTRRLRQGGHGSCVCTSARLVQRIGLYRGLGSGWAELGFELRVRCGQEEGPGRRGDAKGKGKEDTRHAVAAEDGRLVLYSSLLQPLRSGGTAVGRAGTRLTYTPDVCAAQHVYVFSLG